MSEIYLLSCGKSKQINRCCAENMYIGPLFKKSLSYAKNQNPSQIFILSAKHGLLELSDIIDPYEKTLNKMGKKDRKEWSENVLNELKNKTNLATDNFVFLAGEKYRENLILEIEHCCVPMANMKIGKQLQWLKAQNNEVKGANQ